MISSSQYMQAGEHLINQALPLPIISMVSVCLKARSTIDIYQALAELSTTSPYNLSCQHMLTSHGID